MLVVVVVVMVPVRATVTVAVTLMVYCSRRHVLATLLMLEVFPSSKRTEAPVASLRSGCCFGLVGRGWRWRAAVVSGSLEGGWVCALFLALDVSPSRRLLEYDQMLTSCIVFQTPKPPRSPRIDKAKLELKKEENVTRKVHINSYTNSCRVRIGMEDVHPAPLTQIIVGRGPAHKHMLGWRRVGT